MDCDRRKFLQVVAGTVVVGGGLSGMAGLASGKDDLLRPPLSFANGLASAVASTIMALE